MNIKLEVRSIGDTTMIIMQFDYTHSLRLQG